MTDYGPERNHGLERNEGLEPNHGPAANHGLEPNHGLAGNHDPVANHGLERNQGLEADYGPEHDNGHRRHGMEKHEVPPIGDPLGGMTDQATTPDGPGFPVLPTSEHDKLNERLRYAVSSFVDAPRGSVEEADALLEEVSARLVDLLAERRHTLRVAWHEGGAGTAETEELRLAMRGYRNVLERLLNV